MGIPFLKSTYLIFDEEGKQIGFGSSAPPKPEKEDFIDVGYLVFIVLCFVILSCVGIGGLIVNACKTK